MGRRGGGVVSTLPFECWRVPQSLEKGGGMHSSTLSVQTTTEIISETVDIFPNMNNFQSDNLQN
jgi:hypothetical protein